jgi:hypothetical protein
MVCTLLANLMILLNSTGCIMSNWNMSGHVNCTDSVLAYLAHPSICLEGVPETKKIISQDRGHAGGDSSMESRSNVRCVICSDKSVPLHSQLIYQEYTVLIPLNF